MKSFAALLGRWCLAYLFLNAGIYQILHFQDVQVLMAAHGIPLTEFTLGVSIFFQILGAVCLIFGIWVRFGTVLLMLFLVPATWYFHSDITNPEHSAQFMKNLAILGGLLHILVYGSGVLALGRDKSSK